MKRALRKRWIVLAVLAAAGVIAYFTLFRSEPLDTRFNGAYRLEDGRLVVVTAREGDTLRYALMNGESRALWPTGDYAYEAGPGWSDRKPAEVEVTFSPPGPDGRSAGFTWKRPDGSGQARRLDLPETVFTFPSGDLTLRGKLVTPAGPGPFPVVVVVHGSGKESAVDAYSMPYLFASHGIATLIYDKRGTGGSAGKYTQNFHVLARDALAAVGWLRKRSDVDPSRIHLAGYSQGGWIAPLAASKTRGIRSLLINYGPMVPIAGEDRWGYVYALRKKGFGEDAIRQADRINGVIEAIVDHGEDRWDELGRRLDEAEGEPWFEAVKGSDSALGFVAGTRLPLWAMRLYAWWAFRSTGGEPFVDRLYDPVPTLAFLTETPSLWIFGGEDDSMPTQWTVEKLEDLRSKGRPIQIHVFPQADHGILRFEETQDGTRRYLGYEPEYWRMQVEWLRGQSG
ncbi:MAG TPA: alpha/beta fold hydrolase [Thermoanaerobaculia bacterium]